MSAQLSTVFHVGVAAVLAVFAAQPEVTWAKISPGEKKPGQSFEEIHGHIGLPTDKIQAVPRPAGNGRCEAPPMIGKPIPGTERFVTVLNGGAYCDQETGLVWERFPAGGFFDWAGAINHCAALQVAAWKGWSLPSRDQLESLLDIDSILCRGGGLCLPDGHPFQNVQSAGYWSASMTVGTPTFGWLVNFSLGSSLVMSLKAKGLAWCVRGVQRFDQAMADEFPY